MLCQIKRELISKLLKLFFLVSFVSLLWSFRRVLNIHVALATIASIITCKIGIFEMSSE
jgi:hypothetical protein